MKIELEYIMCWGKQGDSDWFEAWTASETGTVIAIAHTASNQDLCRYVAGGKTCTCTELTFTSPFKVNKEKVTKEQIARLEAALTNLTKQPYMSDTLFDAAVLGISSTIEALNAELVKRDRICPLQVMRVRNLREIKTLSKSIKTKPQHRKTMQEKIWGLEGANKTINDRIEELKTGL